MSIGNGDWSPRVGEETDICLAKLQNNADAVRNSAVAILAKGVPPIAADAQRTGLVVGYVQSGKTMSFEAVAALANDNDFRVIIIITGISIPLLKQSAKRIKQDLKLDDPNRSRRWLWAESPSVQEASQFRNVLDAWRDSNTPRDFKETILITVLKNHKHLVKLINLFGRLDMCGVPALIIDDEADQASLNIQVNRGKESTTYRRIMELRQKLPHHTYLQYTATPQALLLINIIDSLSPSFVKVLDPGEAYIGGREFFGEELSHVRPIPIEDIHSEDNPLSGPPPSLIEALRVFMVGVTAGLKTEHNKGNRSMLIHPSHLTEPHKEFFNWANNIFNEWQATFALPDEDRERVALVDEFRDAYRDLVATKESDLPAFEKLSPLFPLAFQKTCVMEVNASSGKTPQIDWSRFYGWVLIGGRAMDRGFTVEGLTVTYMPRGVGIGNVDTLQQRARFLGYKKPYFGYCRLYLEQEAIDAFRRYVPHEEYMRAQLKEIQRTGQQLSDWKRKFILDSTLRPCRKQVLSFGYERLHLSAKWITPSVLLVSDDAINANQKVIDEFVAGLDLVDDQGHSGRTSMQRHKVCHEVSLRRVIEDCLMHIRITDVEDSQRNTGLLLQLARALEENPDEICTVYQMSSGQRGKRMVKNDRGEIAKLFQGKGPREPRGEVKVGDIYPGDGAIKNTETVTMQIRMLDLEQDGVVVKEKVPVISVWIPRRFPFDWIIQNQPTQED